MTDKNIFAVLAGDTCSINLSFRAWMHKYNYNTKFGGCIVQLYYGMKDTFSCGVVERGIHDHQGESFA